MTKSFDPEDPMELVGVEVPADSAGEVLDEIVREYLLLGWQAAEILALFRSPHYRLTHGLYQEKGEAYVSQRVHHLCAEWRRG